MHPMEILDRINRYGIERSERELAELARHARRLGVADAIASTLTDPTAPAIVRERVAARTVAAINTASGTAARVYAAA